MPYFPASQRYSLPYRAIEMRRQRAEKLAALSSRRSDNGFGAQGGDPRRGVDMDLSTCVNRYGPAPAAVAALHSLPAADMVLHPYDAAERIVDLYRWATGVKGGAMIAGRGASEFIWAMGREVDHVDVQVPLPAYTDYLKAFPGRGFTISGEQIPTVEHVDAALGSGGVVIISNPHNPTGTLLDAADLVAAADAHPDATLVVDESYINFTPNPLKSSALGCDVPNLVVLRSTSKFYGIAATRAGIAWSADHQPLKRLFGQQENWGLSGVDVHVVCAAVRDFHWATHSRSWMHRDSCWLATVLSAIPGLHLQRNTNVHFQYAFCERADDVAETFGRHGIGVRVLGAAHGVSPNALRIVAPRADERARFLGAVADVVQELDSSGEAEPAQSA
ncbi:aminotransferase class I/II-fold pyridoxal phosphate-dependent enzyme [Mycolicibacterium moriokaense]|nr:aminotransferase class I/II-fold pyridoxal phosphate-dependent enzyme [Mycolicibacterium moriokaense]